MNIGQQGPFKPQSLARQVAKQRLKQAIKTVIKKNDREWFNPSSITPDGIILSAGPKQGVLFRGEGDRGCGKYIGAIPSLEDAFLHGFFTQELAKSNVELMFNYPDNKKTVSSTSKFKDAQYYGDEGFIYLIATPLVEPTISVPLCEENLKNPAFNPKNDDYNFLDMDVNSTKYEFSILGSVPNTSIIGAMPSSCMLSELKKANLTETTLISNPHYRGNIQEAREKLAPLVHIESVISFTDLKASPQL